MGKLPLSVRDIAYQILDDRVKPYLWFDTVISKDNFFICMFTQSLGIHIYDAPISYIKTQLSQYSHPVLDDIKMKIYNETGKDNDLYLIYFLLLHEESHLIEFLDSGLSPLDYCKQIDLSSYDNRLLEIKDSKAFELVYRDTAYERRADRYALKKLKNMISQSDSILTDKI